MTTALMTDTTTLLDWCLQHRHQYQHTQLLDLLDLARMWDDGIVGPGKVIRCSQLMARWGVANNSAKNRILRLRDAGLIAYTCGDPRQPGYRITRLGPPQ